MFLILYGRSGSGKSTQAHLIEQRLGFNRLISYTTRQPQVGEADGVDYHFVDEETIQKMYKDGELLECCQYDGNYYGSPREGAYNGNTVATMELSGIKQIMHTLKERVDTSPEVCIIKLDCSLKTAFDRCPTRIDRVLYDEEFFSSDDTDCFSSKTVNANLSVEDVYEQILSYIMPNKNPLTAEYIKSSNQESEGTKLKNITFQ